MWDRGLSTSLLPPPHHTTPHHPQVKVALAKATGVPVGEQKLMLSGIGSLVMLDKRWVLVAAAGCRGCCCCWRKHTCRVGWTSRMQCLGRHCTYTLRTPGAPGAAGGAPGGSGQRRCVARSRPSMVDPLAASDWLSA